MYCIVGGVARIVGLVPWPVRGVTAPQRGWSTSSEPMEDSSSLEPFLMTKGGHVVGVPVSLAHGGLVITQVVLSNEGGHGVGVQVLPVSPPPHEPLGPYLSVQEGVPDSAAVQITTAGTGGGASPPHSGADPVMSEGWSSPSIVIAADRASLQVKEGIARAHARAAWPARLAGRAGAEPWTQVHSEGLPAHPERCACSLPPLRPV